MPRPRPLENLATGRPRLSDYQSLTPRTSYSRSDQAEEARGDIELESYDEDHPTDQHQSEPLLASSASASFPSIGIRSGDDRDLSYWKRTRVLQLAFSFTKHVPLVIGIVVAFFLLVMIVISFRRPEVLLRVIGETNITDNEVAPSTSEQEDSTMPLHPNPLDPHLIIYDNYTNFPLLATEYLAECYKLMGGFMHHGAYWVNKQKDVPHREQIDEHGLPEGFRNAICKSSITYMLSGDVGLLADLGLMSQVAALARERNRTFLVDDTYWNRGNWMDHFQDVRMRQPGPEPGCRAPPPEELVACPRSARHWVVNSRTAKFHLGPDFSDEYEDPYSHSLNRLKPIFKSAYDSFVETIRPNAKNAALIRSARDELARLIASQQPDTRHYISVHLRRGDRHAVSWRYDGGYVPVSEYAQAVQDTSLRLSPNLDSQLAVYLASDSPSASAELVQALPSNMLLFSLAQSQNPELRTLANPRDYIQHEFNDLGVEERINLTRGMVIDFALASGMWAWDDDIVPNATICTISSNVCKLSAVGLGWDRAFGSVNEMGEMDRKMRGWVEIDNAGQIEPMWEAFELFS